MKLTITAAIILIVMSFFSYSFSQSVTYQSDKYNQCAWNSTTQSKDLCQEVVSNVQIEINRQETRISITTDGNVTEYQIIDELIASNPTTEFALISADGTAWKLILDMSNNTVWTSSVDDQFAATISYKYN
jgi:hypothetical protein